jgi:hypothetical protein
VYKRLFGCVYEVYHFIFFSFSLDFSYFLLISCCDLHFLSIFFSVKSFFSLLFSTPNYIFYLYFNKFCFSTANFLFFLNFFFYSCKKNTLFRNANRRNIYHFDLRKLTRRAIFFLFFIISDD